MASDSKLRPIYQNRVRAQAAGLFTVTRVRLVICLALYGGLLGGGALLVNLLSRTKFPQEPEHLTVGATVFMSGGAAFVCAVLAGAIAFVVTKYSEREHSHHVIVWMALGFLFGVFSPFVTGAGIPTSGMLMSLNQGVLSAGEVPVQLIDALLRAPSFAFTHGVFGLFTGMLAGALFGAGAWLVDVTNYSPNRYISSYAPYGIAILLGATFYAVSAFGPAAALAKLG